MSLLQSPLLETVMLSDIKFRIKNENQLIMNQPQSMPPLPSAGNCNEDGL